MTTGSEESEEPSRDLPIAIIGSLGTKPDLERGFRVPWVPVLPIVGSLLCIYLMTKLDAATWWRFGAWLALGLLIYAVYGFRNSRLRNA